MSANPNPRRPEIENARDTRLRPMRGRRAAGRVLVAGENEQVRRWAARRLRAIGFSVQMTDSGIDAFTLACRESPNLIVLDHTVAWLELRYLLTLLRGDARTARTPILLITPHLSETSTRDLRRLEIKVFVEPDELSCAVSPQRRASKHAS